MPYARRLIAAVVTFVALNAPAPSPAQDAAHGQNVFRSQCSICHSPQPGRNIIGPSLFGVVGRPCGRVPGFHYSQANLSSGLVWDPATLNRYLAAPQQVVPADVIAYLATLR